jgi:hypothetical protein
MRDARILYRVVSQELPQSIQTHGTATERYDAFVQGGVTQERIQEGCSLRSYTIKNNGSITPGI